MDIVQKPTLKSYFSTDALSIKTSELCESSTGYLWNPIVYTGVVTDITTSIDVPDNQQSTKIVVRLLQPLVNLSHTLWVGNCYISPHV